MHENVRLNKEKEKKKPKGKRKEKIFQIYCCEKKGKTNRKKAKG